MLFEIKRLHEIPQRGVVGVVALRDRPNKKLKQDSELCRKFFGGGISKFSALIGGWWSAVIAPRSSSRSAGMNSTVSNYDIMSAGTLS